MKYLRDEISEEGEKDDSTLFPFIVGAITVLSFVAILMLSTYTVDAGERAILLTWGKPDLTPKEPGVHLKIPMVQNVVKMEIRTQKYEADASAASKDLQTVTAKIATNYHIPPGEVVNVYVNLGQDYATRVIQPMEQEVVKATTARFTAEELITKREEVRQEIKLLLTERLKERAIMVEEISITNFDFSQSFNTAIEAKVTAEQLKLKAENDLKRIRVEAEQAVATAQGQAQSIQVITQELQRSPTYIQYLATTKWDGKLPLATGGIIPFIEIPK